VKVPCSAVLLTALLSFPVHAQTYAPADQGQRPAGGLKILPDDFLRGYDPVTVYFPDDVVASKANADDGPKRMKMVPDWPGAFVWVDRRTLQFRPAEPWPALARFQFTAGSTTRTLTTMMSAPSAMSPAPSAEGLKPFRVVTLTFPQALALPSLKKMLTLEVRDLPGLADSPRRKINTWAVAPLPRASQRDPATYALTLEDDVPEGKQLVVSLALALGNEGTTLWTGRASTRTAFSLTGVRCGSNAFSLLGGASTPKDLALACGNRGDAPQLEFSAPVADLTLTSLRKLVRLEPAVADLRFTSSGSRVQLAGRFVPDTLYKMTLGPAPIVDDSGRGLREVKPAEVFFHLGWKSAFLKWNQSTAIVESKGPRMLPITGYGDARADVRIYRVDALHNGLWPWPSSPIVIDEQTAPPFPGEEPEVPAMPGYVDSNSLQKHIRLLGTPLVSKVIDLPLGDKGNTTQFGLDLKGLLDPVTGASKPGTYLVGLRRLTGRSERAWVRVQVTNLTLTSVEERDKAIIYVRTLDDGDAVRSATVTLEGRLIKPFQAPKNWSPIVKESFTTDAEGRANLGPRVGWEAITRISVVSGDDSLVLDPRESPPRFANNHWSSSGDWLGWLTTKLMPASPNEGTLGFLFSERAIYKPGEPVFLKGFARVKQAGELKLPTAAQQKSIGCIVTGPDGQQWKIPLTTSALAGFAGTFDEKNTPTGTFTASLYEADPSRTISTRQFRIEAYRVPTFEVQLTGKTKVPLDAAFKVKAVARYYAGGNVGNQAIAWSVTQRPYHWMPKGLDGYLFASSTQFARPGSARAPDVTTQAGELDDTGAADITINPQLDLDGSARVYTFEATVTGPDEQPITATTEVKALPPFVLGMKLPRYLEKATTLEPSVLAVGVDDKLVKGQEVRVRLFRRVWHSNLRETSFATGKAKYVTEQEDLQVAEKIVTSGDKPLPLSFDVKEAGVYVVELFSRDKLGRVQTMQADLYIGGQTPLSWNKSKEGVFELKPDKKTYAPGDTAHLLVQSPYTSARALVIVEEPTGNTYTWHNVSGGKAVIDVRVTDKFVPNVPVHVVLMRGRLGEGKTDDARYKPASSAASVDLEVEPVKNLVKLEVLHAEVAKPGTKQDFTILLTDDQKRPVGGEVTFWLVDEAVLSLAREATLDPLSELIRRNSRGTSIRDTRNLVVGRVTELEEDPGGDGSDDENGEGKRLVRKNFKTVPFYAATVTVPPSGKVVIPVTLSDDLTNFKVRVVAVAGAQRFGFKQTTLKVRLPVLVQPQLPRFVRVGDRFWPGGVARLVEGAEGPASIDIKVTGAVEGTPIASTKIDLKAAKAQSVLTPVTVKAVPTIAATSITVRMDVTRQSDKAGDAFEVKLPLLPDRTVEKFSWIETLQPGKTQMKPFPEPARPGTITQSFVVTSLPGVLELASGLEYLSEYPHGCLEQRMSQVAPDLVLGKMLKQLELETRFTPMLNSNVKRLLEELSQNQDDGGFFAYWPGSKGDVALTAQGVEFMTSAKKLGLPVDEKVRTRAMEALKRVLRSDFNGFYAQYRWNQQAAAIRALAQANAMDEHYMIELFQRRKELDPTSLADLAAAMGERSNVFASNLTAMKSELWDAVVFKQVKGKKVFDSIRGDRSAWNGYYLGSSTSSLAAVMEALLAMDPKDERLALLRDGLIAKGSARWGFGTTHDNRRGIVALGLYFEKARVETPRITVEIPGTPNVILDDKGKAAKRFLNQATQQLVTVSGAPVGARVAYSYLPEAPGDRVVAKNDGLVVSRGLTWLHPDNSAPTNHDDAAGKTLKVGIGDVLELHAQIVNDQTRNHVAFVVPFAAGLEPLNPALATSGSDATPSRSDSLTPTFVQRLDHEVRYYFNELPAGTYGFHFRVRASSEGSFVHPAPYAEMMYRESIRGRGQAMRIAVTGSREK